MNNVSQIQNINSCSGCGTCSVVCERIQICDVNGYNIPQISENCSGCGLCMKVCPMNKDRNNYFNDNFYTALNTQQGFVGYSSIPDIRYKCASGGAVTQILLDLLSQKIIDGCIVAHSDGTIENTKAIIATTKDEIIQSRSSKYMPIPMCVALKNIDKTKKYAFVGKGCDIAGLTLLQNINNNIKECIVLKIGIMCASSPSKIASKNLFKIMTNAEYNQKDSGLIYRSEGWPGNAVAQKNDEKYFMPYKESWGKYLAPSGTPEHCIKCTNHFADNADILIGDAWYLNKNLESQKDGYNIIIPLTENGKKYLERVNNIHFEICSKKDILYSQENLIKIQEKALLYDYVHKFFKNKNYLKISEYLYILCALLKYNYKFIRFYIGRKKHEKD